MKEEVWRAGNQNQLGELSCFAPLALGLPPAHGVSRRGQKQPCGTLPGAAAK